MEHNPHGIQDLWREVGVLKGRVDVISYRTSKVMNDHRRVECVGRLGAWFGHRFGIKIVKGGHVVGFFCGRCGQRIEGGLEGRAT